MTTLLRNIASDLVAKRLWPVALVLVAALVAVPLVLGGGEPVTAPPALPATEPEADDAGGLLTLAEERDRLRGSGPRVDPFRKAPEPAADDADTAAAGGDDGGGGGGGAIAGEPAAGSGSIGGDISGGIGVLPGVGGADLPPVVDPDGAGSGGSGDLGEKPAPDAKDSYHVDLRFGPAGDVRELDDVARLSPLPDADDPFFVFLGVLADGETAIFLVSSDATATGEGTCRPSPERCDRIELRAGQTEYFDLTTPEGEVVQYQLDVRAVQRERAADAAAASVARARESADGRALLREAVADGEVDVSDLAYSRELGLVVPTGDDQEQRGAVFGGYRTDVRYGPAGELVKRYNVARLTPLPSVEDPSFVFLGVLPGGERALFLNPTGAGVSGDGICLPDPETCTRVEVPAGTTATLDVPTLDGGRVEHLLAVDGISEVTVGDEREARAARRRESPAGRAILRRLIRELATILADLSFDDASGTLTAP